MKTTKVHILYTGGTIGMAPKDKDNPELVPKSLDKLLKYVPAWNNKNEDEKTAKTKTKTKTETKDIKLDHGVILTFSSIEPVDSSNIKPKDWLDMADKIEEVYDDHDGFVILHGTDTMAFTASGLAFIFENLAKPIVVTGSQLPISARRTDAVMNLVNAVEIAAWKVTGLPCIPEVVVCFADRILRGCRTSKVSSTSWAGFDSPNFPHLGEIGEHIKINENFLLPIPEGKTFQVNRELNTNILELALNPGLTANQLESIMGLPGIDAVVLRTYGAGNAPDEDDFLEAIENISNKKTILNITQCSQGMVEMGLYAASSGMLERGVISGLDMTPEAALTKLYWTLGTLTKGQISTQMQVNQVGEQSENLFDLRYGGHDRNQNFEDGFNTFNEFATPDRRFVLERLSRAVIRFKGLGVTVTGLKKDVKASVRVFMNKPAADLNTTSEDPKCVAEFFVTADDKEINPVREISLQKAKSSIGDGEIVLSVRTDEGVKVWFEGLYLALFARA